MHRKIPSLPHLKGRGASFVSLFRCIVAAVVQRRARSNDARKLARMPDRLLEDIGVTREEIWRRVMKSLRSTFEPLR